uniref:Mas-related G protein-coupled receptor G2 n=2 Tax=Loxodonta africana TaxID=9785 RepID=W8W3N7_LOXAF|nr:TPA: Mas-related G protein-coupled receptor G2 [Loxodonta africana]
MQRFVLIFTSPLPQGDHGSRAQEMFPEPRNDTGGFSPRTRPWLWDPKNGSELPTVNATANNTSNDDGYHSFFDAQNTVFLFTVLVSLCGLVGNGIVIWLLGFCIKRNPFSVYILNLAIADFTFLLCKTVRFIFFLIDFYIVILNLFLKAITLLCYLSSLSFLMAVCTERCLSVLFPIWYKCRRPSHLSAIVCALIWGLSFCPGLLTLLCSYFVNLSCEAIHSVYYVMFFLTFSVLCVSSLILVIQVQCFSWRRQSTKLYVIISLTVLVFLIFGLPLGVGLVALRFLQSFPYSDILLPICHLLSAVNSSVNPIIYFLVGRMRQHLGRKPLREVLQSALTDDTKLPEG